MDIPDYHLPEAAIAQHPIEPRDAARLLVALTDEVRHRCVRDLPSLLGPGDVLAVNSSRVLPARLRLAKVTGGVAEVLLLEPVPGSEPGTWKALVRPGRRLPPGSTLVRDGQPVVEVGERTDEGGRVVRLLVDPAELDQVGEIPLPPYIHEPLRDPERYQTVYANQPGSVAAPTAGLHLTPEVLRACQEAGARLVEVDLAVGLGTFRPVTAERAEDHVMHSERYRVAPEVWAACQEAERVVAVGTTTLRTLESVAATGQLEGRTDLYIRPGYPFAAVDVLLTNFHQPRSTLLLLLEAFAGPRWRDLYALALAEGYRFLSFGDAMVVGRAR